TSGAARTTRARSACAPSRPARSAGATGRRRRGGRLAALDGVLGAVVEAAATAHLAAVGQRGGPAVRRAVVEVARGLRLRAVRQGDRPAVGQARLAVRRGAGTLDEIGGAGPATVGLVQLARAGHESERSLRLPRRPPLRLDHLLG